MNVIDLINLADECQSCGKVFPKGETHLCQVGFKSVINNGFIALLFCPTCGVPLFDGEGTVINGTEIHESCGSSCEVEYITVRNLGELLIGWPRTDSVKLDFDFAVLMGTTAYKTSLEVLEEFMITESQGRITPDSYKPKYFRNLADIGKVATVPMRRWLLKLN